MVLELFLSLWRTISDHFSKLLFLDESGTQPDVGKVTGEFTRVYRPDDRVRDFELSAVDLPKHKKVKLEALPVTSLLLCSSGAGAVASLNSLSITPGQCILCPPGVAVEVSTTDNNVVIYRANRNQGTLPNDSVVSNVAKIIFQELPSLSGDDLTKKTLHAAELLRSVDQYISDIWFRAAAYLELGKNLAKSGNAETSTYSAARWLQKAVHVCDLAGGAANDQPIQILQLGPVVPSKIKTEATTALHEIVSKL